MELTKFNRHKLWCPPKCVPFAQLNRFSLPYIVLALSSAVTKLSSGGSRGGARGPPPPPPPHLFLDQTEARRAEKKIGGRPCAPPFLRVWMAAAPSPAPLSQGLDPALLSNKTLISHDFQGPTIKFHDFPGQENEMLKFHDFPGFL